MEKLFGIELTDEDYDRLLSEQFKGKDLKVINGEVVAVEHEVTQEELNEQRKFEITERLNQLSQDFIQAQVGACFEDYAKRQLEFQELHNELRVLEGKEPRKYYFN